MTTSDTEVQRRGLSYFSELLITGGRPETEAVALLIPSSAFAAIDRKHRPGQSKAWKSPEWRKLQTP